PSMESPRDCVVVAEAQVNSVLCNSQYPPTNVTSNEHAGTQRITKNGWDLSFQMRGRTTNMIPTCPSSTPRLNETRGTATPTPVAPTPRSRSTDANPKP